MLEKKLLDVMNRAVDAGELAGCNLEVLVSGKSVVRLSAGYSDLEAKKPLEYDSIFRLYSETKPITAAAIALLMEQGQLDIGSWVSDFLPGFKNPKVFLPDGSVRNASRPVTISDLLSMTAGLSYPGGLPEEQATFRLFEDNQNAMRAGGGLGTVELMNELGKLPLAFDPGTRHKYSSCADVLGAIVEVVDGRSFSRFLKEEFFEPLNMSDTDFYVPEEKSDRLVTCYRRSDEGLKVFKQLHLCVGDYTKEPAFASGGAGLVSTLYDFGRFATMLINGGELDGRRILAPRTVEWLTSPLISADMAETLWDNLRGYSYGKLMRVCVDPARTCGLSRRGEYGWDGWLGTYFSNFPEEKATILFNQNTKDTGTAPVTRKLRNIILSQMF